METIKPSIVLENGRVYYPTGDEWLMFFASHRCNWAIEALKKRKEEIQMSGYPTMDIVDELQKKIKRISILNDEILALTSDLENKQAHLNKLKIERNRITREIIPCMEKMDVASSGNFGWESRVIAFLIAFNKISKEV